MKYALLGILLGSILSAVAEIPHVRSFISYTTIIEDKECIIVENDKGIGVSCNWQN